MRINQVSVFVGNETGRLVDMLTPLAHNRINIHTLFCAERGRKGYGGAQKGLKTAQLPPLSGPAHLSLPLGIKHYLTRLATGS